MHSLLVLHELMLTAASQSIALEQYEELLQQGCITLLDQVSAVLPCGGPMKQANCSAPLQIQFMLSTIVHIFLLHAGHRCLSSQQQQQQMRGLL
jgi:hypothetical protein